MTGDHFTVNDTHFAFGVGRQPDGTERGALLYKLDPSAVDLARSVFAIEVSDGDSTIIAGPCTLADDEDNLRRYNIPNHGPRSPPRVRRRSPSVSADQEGPPVSASVPVYHYDRTLELDEDPADDAEASADNANEGRSDRIPHEGSIPSSPSSEDSGESSDGGEDSTDAPIGVNTFRPGSGYCEGTWFGVRRAGSDIIQTYYAPHISAPPGQEAQDPHGDASKDASQPPYIPTRLPFIVELLQSPSHERLGVQAGDSRQLAVHVRSLSSNGSPRDFTVLPRVDSLPTDAGADDDVPSGQNPIDSLAGDTFDLRPECRISDIQVVPVPKDFDGVTDLA